VCVWGGGGGGGEILGVYTRMGVASVIFRGYLGGQLDDVYRIDLKLLGSKVIGDKMLGFLI
jgi:hypothetical protein